MADVSPDHSPDRMPEHLRLRARLASQRRANRRWIIVALSLASTSAGLLSWFPAAATGAASAVIMLAGLWQLARADSWERSLRSCSGACMVYAGAWGLLIASTGRADWLVSAAATAAAMTAAWLVWAPHSHPALLRHTTGFGGLDQPAAIQPASPPPC